MVYTAQSFIDITLQGLAAAVRFCYPLQIKNKLGQPLYGMIENGLFGTKIVSGILTGVRFTEDKPVYEISFGLNKWWCSEIAYTIPDLLKPLKLADLNRIKETHGLKIKYN